MGPNHAKLRVAVVGAGWAGLAAAVRLIRAGHSVSLYEAARHVGGRARSLEWKASDGRSIQIDNGQHILIGAYRETLSLMRSLGVDADAVLQRMPLTLSSAGREPEFSLRARAMPSPLHVLGALLGARGLTWADRGAALRLTLAMKLCNWRLRSDCTVVEWLSAYRQTPALNKYIWEPLCLAALNTPPEVASAQIFLNVLRDTIGAARSDSELLLPKAPLANVLPEAASRFVSEHGKVHLGLRVAALIPSDSGIGLRFGATSGVEAIVSFDAAVLAVSADQVPGVLEDMGTRHPSFLDLIRQCTQLSWQAITTVYLLYRLSPFTHAMPSMVLLDSNPSAGNFGQWVFDRERLGGERGLVAVVISADGPHRDLDSGRLVAAVARQVAQQLGTDLQPLDARVITEKRATWTCTPNLDRPVCRTPDRRLVLAGDYVTSNEPYDAYPATLETAVRSGNLAAEALLEHR